MHLPSLDNDWQQRTIAGKMYPALCQLQVTEAPALRPSRHMAGCVCASATWGINFQRSTSSDSDPEDELSDDVGPELKRSRIAPPRVKTTVTLPKVEYLSRVEKLPKVEKEDV